VHHGRIVSVKTTLSIEAQLRDQGLWATICGAVLLAVHKHLPAAIGIVLNGLAVCCVVVMAHLIIGASLSIVALAVSGGRALEWAIRFGWHR
jgi:hypothetical protein